MALAAATLARPAAGRPLAPPPPSRGASSYPAEQVYSLALHMHGSMSEQFGSWEWHTWLADSLGVDIVWWTDHDWRLSNWRHMKRYDFEGTFWEADSGAWAEPDTDYSGQFRFWEVDSSSVAFLQTVLVDSLAYEGTKSLRLEGFGAAGPDFQTGYLDQTTSDVHNKWSLAKRVRLAFAVFPEDLDAVDARFVLDAELSDHPEGNHRLRYVLGTLDGEGVDSIALSYVPGVWNSYVVDVTADAIAHFSTGGADSVRAEDNSLAQVRIGLETRNGRDAVVFFDDYRILPDTALVNDALMDRAREMAAYFAGQYPSVTHYIGTEISKFKAQPHLNAFAPNLQLVDYGTHVWSDTLYYAIDQVHAQGGAVSINHVFGPKFDYQFDPNEPPEHQAQRLRWNKRWMIDTNALGVDVLEVGYRRRGGMDLVHHLELWDALSANLVVLTGNGVTDSHGRGHWNLWGWGPYVGNINTINNFVTWMYTEELSEAGFVQAMKRGRAFFGDPYNWYGTLDLRTLDGFRMGQVVFTDRDSHDLVVEVTNVPPDVQVRLLQTEIREDPPTAYLDIHYLRDEILSVAPVGGVFADTVAIDTTLPSVVRVEVRGAAGEDFVYGNPILFVRDVPAAGVAAERVAVRLGEIRVYLAESFRLTGAWLDGTGALHLTGDEEPVGFGLVQIDPGVLGPPAVVVGAASWNWVGGIVTVQGFSGAGSEIVLSWTPTGVQPPGEPAHELRLAGGRPNPFGTGTIVDYALPRDGWVRLEVIDVAGRRVRVLDLAFRAAGAHRAAWDGRDEFGREVAAGVYWLRLDFDGERLLSKAVRLR